MEDTAWHTLAVCQEYEHRRRELEQIVIDDDGVLRRSTLAKKENLNVFLKVARKVLKDKESKGDRGGRA